MIIATHDSGRDLPNQLNVLSHWYILYQMCSDGIFSFSENSPEKIQFCTQPRIMPKSIYLRKTCELPKNWPKMGQIIEKSPKRWYDLKQNPLKYIKK